MAVIKKSQRITITNRLYKFLFFFLNDKFPASDIGDFVSTTLAKALPSV